LETKKGITEISINGPKKVFIERAGKMIQLAVDLTEEDLDNFTKDVAQIRFEKYNIEDSPIINTNLPDGSRINIIKQPFAHESHAVSIRKYLKEIKTFKDSDGIFGLYGKWIEFLKSAVRARLNIIISGGTGTGKTTLLNLLLQEANQEERIITIEDTLELNFEHKNLVSLESFQTQLFSLSTRDLVKNTLRMRPDRIVIGESRGEEFFDLLQAMNTGHAGSMSTLHASSALECIQRMETLFLLAGIDIPMNAIRHQISSGVNLIIQITRDPSGKRIISEVLELSGMEGDQILSSQLAHFDDGGLKATGVAPKVIDQLHFDGGLPRDFFS